METLITNVSSDMSISADEIARHLSCSEPEVINYVARALHIRTTRIGSTVYCSRDEFTMRHNLAKQNYKFNKDGTYALKEKGKIKHMSLDFKIATKKKKIRLAKTKLEKDVLELSEMESEAEAGLQKVQVQVS
jgi:hypothetical protein